MTRLQELQAKSQTGKMTPADIAEMKAIMSAPVTTQSIAATAPTATIPENKPVNQNMVTGTPLTDQQKLAISMHDTGTSDLGGLKNATADDTMRGASGIEKPAQKTDLQKVSESMGPGYSHVGDLGNQSTPAVSTAPSTFDAGKVLGVPMAMTNGAFIGKESPQPVETTAPEQKGKIDWGGLAKKFGVGLLDVVEAVGKQRGGITSPTSLQTRTNASLAQKQQDFINNLEMKRAEAAAKTQAGLVGNQQTFEAGQNDLARAQQAKLAAAQNSSEERKYQLAYGNRFGNNLGATPEKKELVPGSGVYK